MKIIKTSSYNEKMAQLGNDNLPPGVTNNMIDERFGDGEGSISQKNIEIEITIDGQMFNNWYGNQVFPDQKIYLFLVTDFEYSNNNDRLDFTLKTVEGEGGIDLNNLKEYIKDFAEEDIKNQISEFIENTQF